MRIDITQVPGPACETCGNHIWSLLYTAYTLDDSMILSCLWTCPKCESIFDFDTNSDPRHVMSRNLKK